MKKILSAVLSAIMIITLVCPSAVIHVSADGTANKAGDVNNDNGVNNKDVTVLFRHVSGAVQENIDLVAADCNGDGEIDNKDVSELFRYVCGTDVKLYYGRKPLSPKDPGYVIPDEELSGMNESRVPLSDDGNGAAILTRLKTEKAIKNTSAKPEDTLTRIKFAEDITYLSGFGLNISSYICQNDYSDIREYSSKMKYAEVAVNQGYMLIPEGTEFSPDSAVTYGEVLRGLLYALGYREYADDYGVAKLAAKTGVSNYINLSKKNSETLTYAEYAQVVSNALRQKLVQCIEKNGEYSVVSRGSNYDLKTAYIQNKPNESDALKTVKDLNATGVPVPHFKQRLGYLRSRCRQNRLQIRTELYNKRRRNDRLLACGKLRRIRRDRLGNVPQIVRQRIYLDGRYGRGTSDVRV